MVWSFRVSIYYEMTSENGYSDRKVVHGLFYIVAGYFFLSNFAQLCLAMGQYCFSVQVLSAFNKYRCLMHILTEVNVYLSHIWICFVIENLVLTARLHNYSKCPCEEESI